MKPRSHPTRPNILLVITDGHAAHVAGYAGDRIVQTPNLDRLERQSSRFDQAYCASPACTPSRMSLLTGKDIHHCAGWANHWIIFPEHRTWPRHFTDHGYATCLTGKMHFGGRDQKQGFQFRPYGDLRHALGHQPEPLNLFPGYNLQESTGVTEIPESLNHDVVVTRETLAFVLEHRSAHPQQPWFACASYSRPHPPFTAPGRFFRRYQRRVFAEPIPKDWEAAYDPYTLNLIKKSWQTETTQEINDRGLQGFYTALNYVDDCIGELLSGLERAGALDNTIVIYTSDHGEMCGRHGFFGKGHHFEENIRVPLLIRLPKGGHPKRFVRQPVSLTDLFPTACGLAGLPVPRGLDGIDLSAWIRSGRPKGWPRSCVSSMYCQWGSRVSYASGAESTPPSTPPFAAYGGETGNTWPSKERRPCSSTLVPIRWSEKTWPLRWGARSCSANWRRWLLPDIPGKNTGGNVDKIGRNFRSLPRESDQRLRTNIS